jgi:hypothetical protein
MTVLQRMRDVSQDVVARNLRVWRGVAQGDPAAITIGLLSVGVASVLWWIGGAMLLWIVVVGVLLLLWFRV